MLGPRPLLYNSTLGLRLVEHLTIGFADAIYAPNK